MAGIADAGWEGRMNNLFHYLFLFPLAFLFQLSISILFHGSGERHLLFSLLFFYSF